MLELFTYKAGISLFLASMLLTIWGAAAQLPEEIQPPPSVKLSFSAQAYETKPINICSFWPIVHLKEVLAAK